MKRFFIAANIIIIFFLLLAGIASAGSAIISWNPNSDDDLAGYRIYYGKTKGGPYGSGTALISKTLTSYSVSSLDPGIYYFVVVAVDTAENESAYSIEVSKTISAPTSPATAVTLASNVSSPQTVGAIVTFTAQASGGSGTYEYQFWRTPPGGTSTLAQGYSSSNIFIWNTSGATGTNQIQVRTRVAGTTVASDVEKDVSYTISSAAKIVSLPSPATAVTLASNVSSPQTVGSTVTFTAQASGGSGAYEYQFWRRSPSWVWSVARDYSSENTFAWNTQGATGNNQITVRARITGTTVAYDVTKSMDYTIASATSPATAVTLTPNVSSPQNVGKTVTFTARASGGSGAYEYQFWRRSPGYAWSVTQDYSSKNTFAWNTQGATGTNLIWVRARIIGTTVEKDVDKGLYYVVRIAPATAVTLKSNVASPQKAKKTITFTAQSSGGSGSYEYQFWRRSPSGVWSVVQNYSSQNTFTWNTQGAAGTNLIWVRARSAGTKVTKDVDKGVTFVIK